MGVIEPDFPLFWTYSNESSIWWPCDWYDPGLVGQWFANCLSRCQVPYSRSCIVRASDYAWPRRRNCSTVDLSIMTRKRWTNLTSFLEIPPTNRLVYGCRKGLGSIWRDRDRSNQLGMSVKRRCRFLGDQIPDPERCIVRARYDARPSKTEHHRTYPIGMTG